MVIIYLFFDRIQIPNKESCFSCRLQNYDFRMNKSLYIRAKEW